MFKTRPQLEQTTIFNHNAEMRPILQTKRHEKFSHSVRIYVVVLRGTSRIFSARGSIYLLSHKRPRLKKCKKLGKELFWAADYFLSPTGQLDVKSFRRRMSMTTRIPNENVFRFSNFVFLEQNTVYCMKGSEKTITLCHLDPIIRRAETHMK